MAGRRQARAGTLRRRAIALGSPALGADAAAMEIRSSAPLTATTGAHTFPHEVFRSRSCLKITPPADQLLRSHAATHTHTHTHTPPAQRTPHYGTEAHLTRGSHRNAPGALLSHVRPIVYLRRVTYLRGTAPDPVRCTGSSPLPPPQIDWVRVLVTTVVCAWTAACSARRRARAQNSLHGPGRFDIETDMHHVTSRPQENIHESENSLTKKKFKKNNNLLE